MRQLDLLHPDFRTRLEATLEDVKHLPLRVFETIRSPERQTALYRRGRNPKAADYGRTVTDAEPYESAHQYGLAADVVGWVDGRWTWDLPAKHWKALHAAARANGLQPLNRERPHVQLRGFTARAPLERGPMTTRGWLAWLARMRQVQAAAWAA